MTLGSPGKITEDLGGFCINITSVLCAIWILIPPGRWESTMKPDVFTIWDYKGSQDSVNPCLICLLPFSFPNSPSTWNPALPPRHPPSTQALSQWKLVSLLAQGSVIYWLLPYSTPLLYHPSIHEGLWIMATRERGQCVLDLVAKNQYLDCWHWAESPAWIWPSSLLIFEEHLLPWCFCYEEAWQAILLLAPATL